MKKLFHCFGYGLSLLLPLVVLGQNEPIITVDITQIDVLSGTGSVIDIEITNGGSGYSAPPTVTFSGGGGTGAAGTATLTGGVVTGITITNRGTGYTSFPTIALSAPGTQATATSGAPVLGVPPSAATVTNGGSGYVTAPAVTLTGGTPTTPATAVATVANGAVDTVTLTGGTGYLAAPTITIAPPGTQAVAAVKHLGIIFTAPFQNESFGPLDVPMNIHALARGTFPVTGFSYDFFVNGAPLGKSVNVQPPGGGEGVIGWAPPQPGAYLLTVTAGDGGHTATSLAVRYFATGTSIIGPVDNTLVPIGSSVVIQATATPVPTGPNAFVQRVDFYADGAKVGTDNTYPYSFIYTPTASPTTHVIEARGYDNNGNQISPDGAATRRMNMVTPIGTPPTVRIANPPNGVNVASGTAVTLITEAVSATGFIKNVDFYLNGVQLSSDQTFPFTANWTPQVPGRYQFVAIAFDDKSNAVASAPVEIVVTGGFPSVSITSPTTGAANNIVQGSTVPVSVRAAGADGGISSVKRIDFLVDGIVSASLPSATGEGSGVLAEPFVFLWKANVTVGTHRLSARVTDINDLSITSQEVLVNVVANLRPQVAISTPGAGTSLLPSVPTTITATASDPDGTIASVEFFANGVSIGTDTSSPYQVTWTPTVPGSVDLTARVTDDGGSTATSSVVTVTVEAPSAPGTTVNVSVYRGDYGSPTESGRFTFAVNRNNRGTFIAFSTNPTGRTYFWTDIPISTDGIFQVRDSVDRVLLRGQTSGTGVTGTFDGKTFIGPITLGSSTFTPTVLVGALNGDPASTVVGIVGGDGSITLYSASGNNRQASTDILSSSGAFGFTTAGGGRFSGVVSPAAGTIGGSVTGLPSGTFLLALQPARITNISTRSLAGSGDRTLVAGFVVRGTGTKPLLVRAVGPSLVNFGIPTPLADPALSVLSTTSATLASNNNWGDSAAIATAAAQVGAFPLNASSLDAAVQVSVAPGTYSVVVGGSAATSGTTLVEIYDTAVGSAATSRIANISTRGQVAVNDPLIAGFVIAGDQKKKLLIRAVGPTLVAFGINNALADPRLEILSGSTSIATNNDWTEGAVVTKVVATSPAVGAFPLTANSRDAAIVVELNPGAYTVQVAGPAGATGTVLIEIYDADL